MGKKAGSGGRKHGRNLKKCERYKSSGRGEKTKATRVARRARRLGHGPIKKPSKRSGIIGKAKRRVESVT